MLIYYSGRSQGHGQRWPQVEREGNMLIYYSGRPQGHGRRWPHTQGALSVGVLRRDGFCSIDAGPAEGELVTRPLEWPGGALWVNANMRPRCHVDAGALRVEVLDEAENVLPGYSREDAVPLAGDLNYGECSWGERRDLCHLKGKRIRLRFLLRQARLYSFMAAGPSAPI